MPQFTYTARAVNGELKQATIDAPNRDEVIRQLRQQKLNVIKIDEGSAQKKKRLGAPQTDADVKAGRMPGYAVMWKDANGNLQTIPGKLWRPDVSKMQAVEKANETQRQGEANIRARQNDELYNMNILTGEPLPKTEAAPAPKAAEPGSNIPTDIPAPDELQATPGNAM